MAFYYNNKQVYRMEITLRISLITVFFTFNNQFNGQNSSLLDPFISNKENKVLLIRSLEPIVLTPRLKLT
jgi:hypothetical protein